ncbi:DoxX-like family protein [Sphingobacteriaceae bacterium]|nr:DoxX-like family protein [Sphingobacteriaceae bacterium]
MKTQEIIYWITTVFFSLWMVKNAYVYLAAEQAKKLCKHFGLPNYLRVELGSAKLPCVIILLLPIIKASLKEWAYAGFGITMLSGFIAHLESGGPLEQSGSALFAGPIANCLFLLSSN